MIGLLLLATLGSTALPELERTARAHVVQQFERAGRQNPSRDAALDKAALALAELALTTSAAEAAELVALTRAVSLANGTDPAPRALVVRGSPREEPLRELLGRADLATEAATHLGVAAVEDDQRTAIVVLLAQRKAQLEPFPRQFDQPVPPRLLCTTLAPHLSRMELYVSRPKGEVERIAGQESGGRHCAKVGFGLPGRHTVEVLARGDKGPEVAALFFVQVGPEVKDGPGKHFAEPKGLVPARAALLQAINGLRVGFGVSPLVADPALDAAAQAYAERMVAEDFFAHVGPDGADLRGRLTARGYAYSAAGENLGLASGPLAAHFGIEHSPGHRKNLIDSAFTVAGTGVASRPDGQTVVVELYAHPAQGGAAAATPLEAAYAAIAAARAKAGLPALERAPALERLATEHAGRALSLDAPRIDLPGGRKLHDRVFAALPEVARAAADFFVADMPTLVTDSKNLIEKANALVGVGLVQGDSPTHGKSRFWIVVVYAQLATRK